MHNAEAIRRAVDYIESKLAEDISLFDVANRAGFSVPHFYRLFKAATGQTVGCYLLKRRLARAAHALRSGGRTVTDIAYECGFGSHDVFTRAFIREYGMPPSRFRKQGAASGFALSVADIPQTDRGMDEIELRELDKEEFWVTGMRCIAMEWDEDLAIGRLWSAFLTRVEEIDGRTSPLVMVGLCETEHTEPGRFSYMAAVVTHPCYAPPSGMVMKRLRSQRYIEAQIPELMGVRDAYTQTLAHMRESGFTVDDYDYIEVYEELFRDPADHSFTLWIPIQ